MSDHVQNYDRKCLANAADAGFAAARDGSDRLSEAGDAAALAPLPDLVPRDLGQRCVVACTEAVPPWLDLRRLGDFEMWFMPTMLLR